MNQIAELNSATLPRVSAAPLSCPPEVTPDDYIIIGSGGPQTWCVRHQAIRPRFRYPVFRRIAHVRIPVLCLFVGADAIIGTEAHSDEDCNVLALLVGAMRTALGTQRTLAPYGGELLLINTRD